VAVGNTAMGCSMVSLTMSGVFKDGCGQLFQGAASKFAALVSLKAGLPSNEGFWIHKSRGGGGQLASGNASWVIASADRPRASVATTVTASTPIPGHTIRRAESDPSSHAKAYGSSPPRPVA